MSMSKHLLMRMRLGDDIFRIRADCDKAIKEEWHRLNRIWIVKNEIVKTKHYDEKTTKFNVSDIVEFFLKKSYIGENDELQQELNKEYDIASY